jgi:hypothetical protein
MKVNGLLNMPREHHNRSEGGIGGRNPTHQWKSNVVDLFVHYIVKATEII